jgi:serine/threonine protein kinase/WD40 repeat protein
MEQHGNDLGLTSALQEILRQIPYSSHLIGERVGAYELVDVLGEGGMGEVFLARHVSEPSQYVALKLIKLGMDSPQIVARFHLEQRVLQQLDHPNIARFIESGISETGRAYFAMELIRGVPITDYCDHFRLTIRERIRLLATVCHAVEYAAEQGIVHRDLKPSNVLVTEEQGTPVAKVIDFGLAKAFSEEFTPDALHSRVLGWVGTMQYMSPEQSLGRAAIDRRTDVYSLGVMLFELLTGSPPLSTTDITSLTPEQWRFRILEDESPYPSERITLLTDAEQANVCRFRSGTTQELVHQLRGDLDAITRKALEKSPDQRYATPGDLGTDLQAHLSYRRTSARRGGAVALITKWYQRNRKLIRTAITAAILLGGVAVVACATLVVHSLQSLHQNSIIALDDAKLEQHRNQVAEYLSEAATQWQQGDWLSAREALGFVSNSTDDAIRHEFSYRYLKQQLNDGARLLNHHGRQIMNMDLARHNHWIASCDTYGDIIVSECTSGRRLIRLVTNSEEMICVRFSPDETMLAGAGQNENIRIWNTKDWKLVAELGPHQNSVRSVAWSPDGRRIAAGDYGGRLLVWNVETQTLEFSYPESPIPMEFVVWSPSGKHIAATRREWGVRVWDVNNWKSATPVTQATIRARSLAFNSDGSYLAVVDSFGEVTIARKRQTGYAALQHLHLGAMLQSIQFDGRDNLLVGTVDGRVAELRYDRYNQVWRASRFVDAGVDGKTIVALAPSPDEKGLYFATVGHASIKHVGSETFPGYTATKLVGSPAGIIPALNVLVREGDPFSETVIQSLAGDDGAIVATLPCMVDPICRPAYCAKRELVALATVRDGQYNVVVYEAASWKLQTQWEMPARVRQLSFSNEGDRILVSSDDGAVQLRNLRTLDSHELYRSGSAGLTAAAFSRTDSTIAAGAVRSKSIFLWDSETLKQKGAITTPVPWNCFEFHSKDHSLFVGHGNRITAWDYDSLQRVTPDFRITEQAVDLCLSPSCRTLVSLTGEGTVTLLDIPSRKQTLTLVTPKSKPSSIEFADGDRLYVGINERKRAYWLYKYQVEPTASPASQ